MPPEGTADQTVVTDATGQTHDGEGNWREENTKLRQQLAEQKALNSKATPWVNVAVELQKQEPTIFEKLVRGEPLTAKQQQTVVDAQQAAGEKPLTRAEFSEMMKENLGGMMQQMQTNQLAAEAMKELDGWATKELPGYDNVKKAPTWNGILSSVLGSIENGTFKVPESVGDPWKFALQTTYDIFKAKDPELLKGDRRAKSEEDKAAEILLGGRKPSSSKKQDELGDLPDDVRREIEYIRGIGEKKGKKFSP